MYLIVNEIFHSLQGETTTAGFPSLFIRLAGCNLKCTYCDTAHARSSSSGKEMAIDSIIKKTESYKNIDHVTITGGEPLLQADIIPLMIQLIKKGYDVQIETNGSISIKEVPKKVRKIVDVKTPSSGESNSFLPENLKYLCKSDELKFVILDIKRQLFVHRQGSVGDRPQRGIEPEQGGRKRADRGRGAVDGDENRNKPQ